MRSLFFTLVLFLSIKTSAQIELTHTKIADPKKMEILSTRHSVTKVGDNEYIIRVSTITDSFPLTISYGDKAVFTKYYRVRTLEQLSVRFGDIDSDGIVNKQDLLSNPFVSLSIKYIRTKAITYTNKLSSYAMKMTDEKGEVLHEKTNTEPQLSNEQITLIKSLKPGAVLELKNCIASGRSNEFEVKGLKLTIR